ncbi:hypothetical protein [Erythrobacter sp.]|uniref:hypothetical protein n=1 Tax=Erythrobacter sp. TaxID=1042 RepID=UPI0025CD94FA|nr:hypothetical protein [Erythrobacter sp.]
MSAGGESLFIYIGVTMTVASLAAIVRPDMLVRESRRNWKKRLRELDAGAPEAFFEERRELEAYPPRFDLSNRTLRLFGMAGLALGIFCILKGLST